MRKLLYWRKKYSPVIYCGILLTILVFGVSPWIFLVSSVLFFLLPCGMPYFNRGEGLVLRQAFATGLIVLAVLSLL
jgi:hypothetical protein